MCGLQGHLEGGKGLLPAFLCLRHGDARLLHGCLQLLLQLLRHRHLAPIPCNPLNSSLKNMHATTSLAKVVTMRASVSTQVPATWPYTMQPTKLPAEPHACVMTSLTELLIVEH